jgi:hypothetical protein
LLKEKEVFDNSSLRDRRKSVKDIFAVIAEARIRLAMEKGEFNNLPGKGKPLAIDNSLALVPAEERIAYIVMKNAGLVPGEAALLQEIDSLKMTSAGCLDRTGKRRIDKKLRETNIRYNILMEKRRSRR